MIEKLLAKRTTMNTPEHINIFCTIMEEIIRGEDSLKVDITLLLNEILKYHYDKE